VKVVSKFAECSSVRGDAGKLGTGGHSLRPALAVRSPDNPLVVVHLKIAALVAD